jgi:hypothetical protein
LLSYYYAYHANTWVHQLGLRCNSRLRNWPWNSNTPACRDSHPGAFHIVLTNQLGLKGEFFVSELDRGEQVWNYAIYRYQSQIIGQGRGYRGAAPGTVRTLTISTTLWMASDDVAPRWDATVGTPQFEARSVNYKYYLELDAYGRIIGGEWISWDRPDFLWMQGKAYRAVPR